MFPSASDMFNPSFDIHDPPYRKPITQQPFKNHPSILHTHSFSKNASPEFRYVRPNYSNEMPIMFRKNPNTINLCFEVE